MADINTSAEHPRRESRDSPLTSTAAAGVPVADDQLITFVELLFFAYRDFTGEADALLDDYGFGRAHHRVLHFVHRSPGLRVADLLDILKITKQSLAPVLKQLIDQGYIVQRAGTSDRRQRLLYVTGAGASLAQKLAKLQIARIKSALAAAGPGASEAVSKFLLAVVSSEDRATVSDLIAQSRLLGGDER